MASGRGSAAIVRPRAVKRAGRAGQGRARAPASMLPSRPTAMPADAGGGSSATGSTAARRQRPRRRWSAAAKAAAAAAESAVAAGSGPSGDAEFAANNPYASLPTPGMAGSPAMFPVEWEPDRAMVQAECSGWRCGNWHCRRHGRFTGHAPRWNGNRSGVWPRKWQWVALREPASQAAWPVHRRMLPGGTGSGSRVWARKRQWVALRELAFRAAWPVHRPCFPVEWGTVPAMVQETEWVALPGTGVAGGMSGSPAMSPGGNGNAQETLSLAAPPAPRPRTLAALATITLLPATKRAMQPNGQPAGGSPAGRGSRSSRWLYQRPAQRRKSRACTRAARSAVRRWPWPPRRRCVPGSGVRAKKPLRPSAIPTRKRRKRQEKKKHPYDKVKIDHDQDDWALRNATRHAAAISRPIHVDCYPDRIVLVPEAGSGEPRVISLRQRRPARCRQARRRRLGNHGYLGHGRPRNVLAARAQFLRRPRRRTSHARPHPFPGRQRAGDREEAVSRTSPPTLCRWNHD